ncbi:hypothetical protein RJ640_003886 [Escallonia rubra]|uniref:GAG-pre-integrase domain-containing protein n=1 Tax=Escallonia rubra TaxID=112253 RepID=A0AA88R9I2_9ASTE|nr:hypothetical protein RJ640_003886 [Escallonia rubra]
MNAEHTPTWSDFDSSDEDNEKNDQANVCFMANDEVCLKEKSSSKKWILDSGCSRHMTGNIFLFISIDLKEGGNVTFGDNYQGKIKANQDVKCLSAISETSWLWHRRLGHMHMEHLKDISSKELVRGLPKIKFEKDKVCDACQMGKQKKVSHKPKKMVSTSRPL